MSRFRIDGSIWRGRLLFSLFFLTTTYWASYSSSIVHELLGHGLVAKLVGQNFYGLIVTLTRGTALVTVSGISSTDAMISASGVIAQFLFGFVLFLVSFLLKGFTTRIVTLTFAITAMINSSSYLFIGSLVKQGDAVLISSDASISLEMLALVGFGLLVFVGLITFPQFVRVLQDFLMFKSRRDAYISVVFIFLLGSFPYFLLTALVGSSPYPFIAFLSVAPLALTFFAFVLMRYKLPDTGIIQQKYVSWRGIGTNLLLAVICTTVWLGVFGYTVETAHGMIWHEFGSVGVVNVKVTVYGNFVARVEMRFRPQFTVQMSENLWLSVKNWPNWKTYEQQAMLFARDMFNTLDFQVVTTKTDDADIWYMGKWHGGGARVVVIDLNLASSLNLQGSSDKYGLVINDPWTPVGFLDSFNFTCYGMKMLDYDFGPVGSFSADAGGLDEGYLLWLNENSREAPNTYFFMFSEE